MSNTQKAPVFHESTDKATLTKIVDIKIPQITETQVLVKAVAYAANPTDFRHREAIGGKPGDVVGTDLSGYVVKRGSKVTKLNEGDIVSGTLRGNFSPENGGFAQFVAIEENLAIKYDKAKFDEQKILPEGTNPSSHLNTFEAAASVTLGLATVGLSFAHNLKLLAEEKTKNSSKSILIWGGATATGILAIQVAKLVYGLNVITTASAKHHEFLTSIGADKVFDYKDDKVVSNIKNYAHGNIAYALDTVATKETFQQTYDATEGSEHVLLDNLLLLGEKDIKTDSKRNVDIHYTLVYVINGEDHYAYRHLLGKTSPELVADYTKFWQEELPPHLDEIKTAKLTVLPAGLGSVNKALELLVDGRQSGEKLVFRAA